MSGDWYRDHRLSPEASDPEEYRDWAYEAGAYIDPTGWAVWPGERDHPDTRRQDGEL